MRVCVCVEVRHPCARLSAHRGRAETPASRGNVCALRERETSVRGCLSPRLFSFSASHFYADFREALRSPWLQNASFTDSGPAEEFEWMSRLALHRGGIQ